MPVMGLWLRWRVQQGVVRPAGGVMYRSMATLVRYGPSTSGDACKKDGNQRDADLQAVRPQIDQQPPHQATVVSLADNVVVLLLGALFGVCHATLLLYEVSVHFSACAKNDACESLDENASRQSMQNLAPALGIYVSIPFCRAKCSYCNFASGVYGADRMAAYVEKLAAEIREAPERVAAWGSQSAKQMSTPFTSEAALLVFLTINQIEEILKAIQEVFSVEPSAEITLECAPGQLSDEMLHAMPGLGFNRVSLGVQSFVDHEAAAVGRTAHASHHAQ